MTTIRKGLIDLIFLIVFISLILFGNRNNKKHEKSTNERAIDIVFGSPSSTFSFDSTHGTYKKIYFTGATRNDSLKMKEIREYLSDFQLKMDTIEGVHIVFGDNSKYGDFIKIINFCIKEKIMRFIPYQNNLWIPAGGNIMK